MHQVGKGTNMNQISYITTFFYCFFYCFDRKWNNFGIFCHINIVNKQPQKFRENMTLKSLQFWHDKDLTLNTRKA